MAQREGAAALEEAVAKHRLQYRDSTLTMVFRGFDTGMCVFAATALARDGALSSICVCVCMCRQQWDVDRRRVLSGECLGVVEACSEQGGYKRMEHMVLSTV